MTLTSSIPCTGRRWPVPLIRILLGLLAQARERRRIRKEMAELAQLPEHLIRDMGLEDLVPLQRDPEPLALDAERRRHATDTCWQHAGHRSGAFGPHQRAGARSDRRASPRSR